MIKYFDKNGMMQEVGLKEYSDILENLKVFIDSNGDFIKNVIHNKKPVELNLGQLIYPIYQTEDSNGIVSIVMAYKHIKKDEVVYFSVENKDFESQKFWEKAADNGYSLPYMDSEKKRHFMDTIRNLKHYLLQNTTPRRIKDQMGWHDGNFYIGNKILKKDGNSEEFVVPQKYKSTFGKYHKQGDKKKFMNAINVLNDPIFNIHKMFFLLQISVPLYKIKDLGGPIVSLHSKYSGSGKSVALYMGQSFYGEHDNFIADFTYNYVISTLSVLNNMPGAMDEISEKLTSKQHLEHLNSLVYQVNQGKSKGRSTQDGGFAQTYDYNNTLVVTTNTEISNMIADNNNGVPKSSRLYELSIKRGYTHHEISKLSDALAVVKENFGFGQEALHIIAKNRETIKDGIDKLYNEFSAKFNESNYRFIANAFACATVMAELLGQLGYEFNHEEVKEFFMNDIERVKETVTKHKVTAQKIFENFWIKHSKTRKEYVLVGKRHEVKNADYIDMAGINSQLCLNDFTFSVVKTTFDKFLNETYSISSIDNLKDTFAEEEVSYETKKVTYNNVAMNSYVFKLKKENFGADDTIKDTGLQLIINNVYDPEADEAFYGKN